MNPLLLAKQFFKSKFNIALFILLVIIGIALVAVPGQEETPDAEGVTVHFFYLPTCPHCADQKPILEELAAEMPDVTFFWHDASSQEGSALFYQMATEQGLDVSRLSVPTIFFKHHSPLIGFHSKADIMDAIEKCKEACIEQNYEPGATQEIKTGFTEFELPFLGRTDLTSFSLPVLAIVLGLIDGFNPCAMWVLVYLIALLMEVKDKRKIWIIAGSFVLSSGILYFLFMTAWLNVFLFLGYIRPLTILIGLVALGGGILNFREFLTKKEALQCEVTDEESNKKTMGRIQRIVSKELTIATVLAIIVLAFLVNSVEFVCSSAIPAVFTQILALSNLSTLAQYGYILLYDIFFMLDDIIIFGLAAFAVTSGVGEKYAKYTKGIGGIILIAMGIILLFAPSLVAGI